MTILTPDRVLELRARFYTNGREYDPAVVELCDSHEALRAELTAVNETMAAMIKHWDSDMTTGAARSSSLCT